MIRICGERRGENACEDKKPRERVGHEQGRDRRVKEPSLKCR